MPQGRWPLVVLVLVAAAPAEAQVLEAPPRSDSGVRRPLDPNRSRQEVTLMLHFLGSYDDRLAAEGEGAPADPLAPSTDGYTGTVAGALRYWRGRPARHLEATGRTHATAYSDLVPDPLVGAEGSVRAATSVGARTNLTGALQVGYRPTFAVGSGESMPTGGESVPQADPTIGVSEFRSLTSGASAGVGREWTRRQQTTVGYHFNRQDFSDDAGLDSRSHGGTLTHRWDFTRAAGLRASYSYSEHETADAEGFRRPLTTHGLNLGFEARKRISPRRHMVLAAGGGAMQARTFSTVDEGFVEYVTPSGFASINVDLARTWTLAAEVRREVSPLFGLTRQSFVADSAALSAGGRIGSRLLMTLSGDYSRGEPRGGDVGSYESLTGTLQVNYVINTWSSLVTSYTHYDHTLRGITGVPGGFPGHFTRNSVRLGVTLTLPLHGSRRSGRAPVGE